MQGRRQGVEQKRNDHPDRWLSLLFFFGGQAEERGACSVRGQEAPGFHERKESPSLKYCFPHRVELRMSNWAFAARLLLY